MLSRVIPLLALVSPALAEPGHRIEIVAEGAADTKVILGYHMDGKTFVHSEGQLVAGRAVFEGPEPLEPGMWLVAFAPKNTWFDLLIDDDATFVVTTRAGEPTRPAKVEGAPQTAAFVQDFYGDGPLTLAATLRDHAALKAARDEAPPDHPERPSLVKHTAIASLAILDRASEVERTFPGSLYAAFIRALVTPDPGVGASPEEGWQQVRRAWFKDINLGDRRLIRTWVLLPRIETYLDKLTVQSPAAQIEAVDEVLERASADPEVFKHVAVHLVNRYAQTKIVCMDAVYAHLVDTVYRAGRAPWADEATRTKLVGRSDAMRPTLCGAVAPDVPLTDREGNATSVHRAAVGRTVIFTWGAGCDACAAEAAKIKAAMPTLPPDIRLVTVYLHPDHEGWKEQLDAWGLGALPGAVHTVQGEDRAFSRAYDLTASPRVFVLDGKQRIFLKSVSGEQLAGAVASWPR